MWNNISCLVIILTYHLYTYVYVWTLPLIDTTMSNTEQKRKWSIKGILQIEYYILVSLLTIIQICWSVSSSLHLYRIKWSYVMLYCSSNSLLLSLILKSRTVVLFLCSRCTCKSLINYKKTFINQVVLIYKYGVNRTCREPKALSVTS